MRARIGAVGTTPHIPIDESPAVVRRITTRVSEISLREALQSSRRVRFLPLAGGP